MLLFVCYILHFDYFMSCEWDGKRDTHYFPMAVCSPLYYILLSLIIMYLDSVSHNSDGILVYPNG